MVFRLLLRALSLGAKFALTVVIAHTLGFGAVAEYGLAVGVSVTASKLFGLGFSVELNRRMSGAAPVPAIATARTLCLAYASFYSIAGLALLAAWGLGKLPHTLPDARTCCLMLLVAFSEHYALEANGYVFSVHRVRAGSAMLFMRTGGWAAIAIAGLTCGTVADMRTIFALWIITNASVIVWAWQLLGRIGRTTADTVMKTMPQPFLLA
ncbi:hypothetical protein BRCH_03222 [Candidatus Burkholderia brachyanthoides]|nr:hypothetical protein BRCH_03222 [Candidatus Burkholderia brachyanthoides]